MTDISINEVIYSIRKAIYADEVHQKARDGYEGYDWAYHGYEYQKCADECADDADKKLSAYIDQRIAAIAKAEGAK